MQWLKGPLAHFAAGDEMVDAAGNQILDAAGNCLLDDGVGNARRCAAPAARAVTAGSRRLHLCRQRIRWNSAGANSTDRSASAALAPSTTTACHLGMGLSMQQRRDRTRLGSTCPARLNPGGAQYSLCGYDLSYDVLFGIQLSSDYCYWNLSIGLDYAGRDIALIWVGSKLNNGTPVGTYTFGGYNDALAVWLRIWPRNFDGELIVRCPTGPTAAQSTADAVHRQVWRSAEPRHVPHRLPDDPATRTDPLRNVPLAGDLLKTAIEPPARRGPPGGMVGEDQRPAVSMPGPGRVDESLASKSQRSASPAGSNPSPDRPFDHGLTADRTPG